MKIDKIIFTTDSNINYLSFWNKISEFYKKYHGIDCKLIFISDKYLENKNLLSEEFGEVCVVKPLDDIPIIIQTLWGKFWFTQNESQTKWLIGDIDLFLLKKDYLENCLRDVPDDSYAHVNANGYKQGNWWQNASGIPGYFHCAKGETFKKYLDLSDSFEAECSYIYNSKKYGILYNGMAPSDCSIPQRVKDKKEYGFICCEENRTTELLAPKKDSIFSFTYPDYLNRIETPYASRGLNTPENFDLRSVFNKFKKDQYIDFHCPRPYSKFSSGIDYILSHYID